MTRKFKTVAAVAAMAALIGSSAQAADAPALAPGKPAGVQHAARGNGHLLLTLGVATVVIVGVVVAVASSNKASAPATTSTTP